MWERHQRMLVWGGDLVLLPREERQRRWKRKCGKRGGKIQQKVLDELQLPFQICLALVSRLGVLSRVQTHNQAANSQSEWASSRPRGAKLKVLKNYLDIFGYWSKKQNWSSVVHRFMKYRPLRFSENWRSWWIVQKDKKMCVLLCSFVSSYLGEVCWKSLWLLRLSCHISSFALFI